MTVIPLKKREISRDDIMDLETYAGIRRAHRRALVEVKKNRRLDVGPFVTFYFENYDTMWSQVQEMLFIEKGGDEQIADELSAYNPLIPQGSELVATMMIEIEDEKRRRATLSRLGWIEDKIVLSIDGNRVVGEPEDDIERTTEDGKTSAVHFITFRMTEAQKRAFRKDGAQVILGIEHDNYGHMAVMPDATVKALASDLD